MVDSLESLSGRAFDVAVIGAGINGAAAAQELAAAGYKVLLVDKQDYAAGASSRSSSILHCGLRYLAPGTSAWEFVRNPGKFGVAMRMARNALIERDEFVQKSPDRAKPSTFFYPVYKGGTYAPWQMRIAFAILNALAPKGIPVGSRRYGRKSVADYPILGLLRDADKLADVFSFEEYVFDWPERICVDCAMDARRMGAVVRNYTSVTGLQFDHSAKRWTIQLSDVTEGGATAVTAGHIINAAGVWIDKVNAFGSNSAPRKIFGTKGANIVVRLPDGCQGYGIAGLNQIQEPIYARPWGNLHYIGPTETVFEGDPDDVYADEDDIGFLLKEANYLFPTLRLKREDVIYTWAGVRPLTYDPAYPKGKRSMEIHDLGNDGMPNTIAITAGPIMTHRIAGQQLLAEIAKQVKPSGQPKKLDTSGRTFTARGEAPISPLLPAVTASQIQDIAKTEQCFSLIDIMFRRARFGWTETMGSDVAADVASIVADELGWSAERARSEVADYLDYLATYHRFHPAGVRESQNA